MVYGSVSKIKTEPNQTKSYISYQLEGNKILGGGLQVINHEV